MAWMIDTFSRKDLDAPRRQTEMLLEHVFGCKRLALYTDPDRPASPLERQGLRDLIGRALKHEPVQYLVGEAAFFGLDFKVDPRVLIPRPSTATIVEEVLQHDRAARPGAPGSKGEGLLIADICTGSGCIAISLLKNLPLARAVASDISPQALEIAAINAQRHGVADRIDFVTGDLFDALEQHPVARCARSIDYLVSNPPYIPDDEWNDVEPNVKNYEPHLALRGGTDGMSLVTPIIQQASRLMTDRGLLLVEVASSRAPHAAQIAAGSVGLTDIRTLRDIDGLARVISARRE
jgi:release factor glutamine methyltransferase